MCNKIKALKATTQDIAEAVKDSDKIEVSSDTMKLRRANNAPLPERAASTGDNGGQKKRDAKASDKEDSKKQDESKEQEIEYDEKGNPILSQQDFENPMIIHFKTSDTKDADFKVNWKDVERTAKEKFPKLKIVYSRADQYNGELAISSYKLNTTQLDEMTKTPVTITGHEFTFEKLVGEELKAFW